MAGFRSKKGSRLNASKRFFELSLGLSPPLQKPLRPASAGVETTLFAWA